MTAEEVHRLRPRIRQARRFAESLLETQPSRDAAHLVETLEDCQRLADLPILVDRIDTRRRR